MAPLASSRNTYLHPARVSWRTWRELVRARTSKGRKRAKERGVHMGRPAKLPTHQRRDALKALADGTASQADLARRFNVSQATIFRLAP